MQAYQALRAQLDPSGQNRLRQESIAFVHTVRSQCGIGALDSKTARSSPAAIPCVLQHYLSQRNLLAGRLIGPAAEEAARPLQAHTALQADLKALGFLPADSVIDGVYGPATRAAILQWQQSRGRSLTGVLGKSDSPLLEQQPRLHSGSTIATPLASTDHHVTALGGPAPSLQATAPGTWLVATVRLEVF